jgi:hypothetical protein
MSNNVICLILNEMIDAITEIHETTKILNLPSSLTGTTRNKKKPTSEQKKEQRNRVVLNKNRWKRYLIDSDFIVENQNILLQTSDSIETQEKQKIFHAEINQKINSYKHQDIEKSKYNPEHFVHLEFVLSLLRESRDCFYCKEPVNILYQISRDPKQWTLERIDNNYGHNIGNVAISCLSCNIRRRTMYHEKYIFTKQTKFIKEKSSID